MSLYKVTADLEGYELNAVVACEKADDALKLAGFDGESYSEQEVTWIGHTVSTLPSLICAESL